MKQEEKDLCKTCEHFWLDFPLPLDRYVPHCEVIDENRITDYVLDDIVPYPCLECPFGCYSKKK